jgi:hypothetical protein
LPTRSAGAPRGAPDKRRLLPGTIEPAARIVIGRELQSAVDAITARLDVIERKLGIDAKARSARVRLEVQAEYSKRLKAQETALGIEHQWPD